MSSTTAILEHLIFHRALSANPQRINEYINMINNLKENAEVAYSQIKNPLDRELTLIFELVLEQKLNPWDIDLTQFAELYLKRIKKEREIDLITAGYLVLLAWTILKLQSDNILERSRFAQAESELSWDVIPDWTIGDEAYDYTTAVLQGRLRIEERIRRKGARRVTLIELVKAFEDASRLAELRKIRLEERGREKQANLVASLETLDKKLHKEELDEDMKLVWNKLLKFKANLPIPLHEICNGSKEEFITGLVSVLFLTTKRKLKVWQLKFPYGKIFVKRLS